MDKTIRQQGEITVGYTSDYLEFVSSGICPGCKECMNNHGYEDKDLFENDYHSCLIEDEGSFSWNPCDDCSSGLGGDSHVAHGVDKNGEIVHFKICTDCLMEYNGYTWNSELECYE